MDYFAILKKSYEITCKHRYLWIFGILTVGFSGFRSSYSEIPQSTNINQYFSNYWSIILIALGVLFILGIIWFIFSIISNAALIGSVKNIINNNENNFYTGYKFGKSKFWQVFGMYLTLFGIIIFTLILTGIPIGLLIWAHIYVLAIIFGVILFLIDLVIWIYLGIIFEYALRYVILDNIKIQDSFLKATDLFKKKWGEILIMYLILMLIGFGVGMAYIFILIFIGGLLFAIGFGIYLVSILATIIYAIIAGILFSCLIIFISGVIRTFTSASLTQIYLELTKSKSPKIV